MLFFNKMKKLANEFFAFKKYKAMHPVVAVFTGICLLPFAAGFILGIGILFLLSVILSFFDSPLTYLHNVVREQGKEVRCAAEFIIYFISWPLLFLLYSLYALFTFVYYLFYFATVVDGYIASLVGFKFHISPLEEYESINLPEGKRYTVQGAVYAGIVLFLILVLGIYAIVLYNVLYYSYQEGLFLYRMYLPTETCLIIYELFTLIYIPIAFKTSLVKPVESAPEEVEKPETPKEETGKKALKK